MTDDASQWQVVDSQNAVFTLEFSPEDSEGVLKEEVTFILKTINIDEANRVEHLMSRKILDFVEGFPKW